MSILGEAKAKPRLPWWTWVLPFIIFHFGSGLSVHFQVATGMSLWYFPIPLGLILIQWWGPRVLPALYLNAVLCAGYWGLFKWWYWPLYALPETLKVGLSWFLFTRLAQGQCWLPNFRHTWKFLWLGIAVPVLVGTLYGQAQMVLLGDAGSGHFIRTVYREFVLDILNPFAVTVPALLFATSFLERRGLTVTRGAWPRPTLVLTDRWSRAAWFEIAVAFSGMSVLTRFVSWDRDWFLLGIFVMWAAVRFGVGLAALAGTWSIMLTLMLPAMLSSHFAGAWMALSDPVKTNLNLAVLCVAALAVGRALSDVYQEIDQRKRAESALRESEEKYRTLFDSASDAIVISDGNILECNRRCLELFGATREDLLGASTLMLFAEELSNGVPIAIGLPEIRNRVLDGNPMLVEVKARKLDGTLFDVESSLRAAHFGGKKVLFAAIRDITERKSMQKALIENEGKYRTLFESANDAIVLTENGHIIDCNQRASEMFRFSRGEMVGADVNKFFPKAQGDGVASSLRSREIAVSARSGKPQFIEWIHQRADGTMFETEAGINMVLYEGRKLLLAVIRDITERKSMQKALIENEGKYRTLFESANDAVILSENGVIVDCNQRCMDFFRYRREDLVGFPTQKIFPEFQADGVASTVRSREIREAAMAGQTPFLEWLYRRADGTTFASEISLNAVNIDGRRMLLVMIRDISDQKRAQKDLAEREEKYRTLFESANDAIMLVDQGVVVDCNRRCLDFFGCRHEDLVGFPSLKFFPEFQADGAASAARSREIRGAALEGKSQVFEWLYRRADGTTFDSDTSLNAVTLEGRRMVLVVIRDLSDRRRMERALIESEERFRQMAENIQEVFFLLDRASQTMLYVSPVAEEILGIPVSHIAADPLGLESYMHLEDRDRIGFFRDGAWHRREFNEDFRYLHPDNRLRWLRLKSFLIRNSEGEVYRVAGVVADITDYKTAQESARMHQQQLIQADKMNSLGMMVSGVAHEINNPNNLIMLNADVLETFWRHLRPVIREHAAGNPDWKLAGLHYGNAEGKLETLLSGLSGGAKRIQRIVENLKDFARMDAGDLTESVEINKVIDASVGIVDPLIRKTTDRFEVTRGENLPAIKGNFQKLEQVVINLITNACQALESRSKFVRVATWYEDEKNEVVLRVEDEGKGIPKELLHKVADPFFTTKRDTGGTGLGLSVSYGIIREHNGRIEFRSEPDQGTQVEIRFPATAEAA